MGRVAEESHAELGKRVSTRARGRARSGSLAALNQVGIGRNDEASSLKRARC
jgi:hypothetical protein